MNRKDNVIHVLLLATLPTQVKLSLTYDAYVPSCPVDHVLVQVCAALIGVGHLVHMVNVST